MLYNVFSSLHCVFILKQWVVNPSSSLPMRSEWKRVHTRPSQKKTPRCKKTPSLNHKLQKLEEAINIKTLSETCFFKCNKTQKLDDLVLVSHFKFAAFLRNRVCTVFTIGDKKHLQANKTHPKIEEDTEEGEREEEASRQCFQQLGPAFGQHHLFVPFPAGWAELQHS